MKRTQNTHFASLLNTSKDFIQLGEEISFNQNKNLVFSWPDFAQACDLFENEMNPSSQMFPIYQVKKSQLEQFKFIPVWLKAQDGKIQKFSIYELYELCILNKFKDHGLDVFRPLEVSFISTNGPFKLMSPSECLNKEVYQDFVMIFLLENKLPRRNFRIRLNAKVLFGATLGELALVKLQQLTDDGFLFAIDSEYYFKQVAHFEKIKFTMNPEIFLSQTFDSIEKLQQYFSSKNFDFLYSAKKEHEFSFDLKDAKVQSSFDFYKDKKIYLYVSYNSVASAQELEVSDVLKFVNQAKCLIKNSFLTIKKTA